MSLDKEGRGRVARRSSSIWAASARFRWASTSASSALHFASKRSVSSFVSCVLRKASSSLRRCASRRAASSSLFNALTSPSRDPLPAKSASNSSARWRCRSRSSATVLNLESKSRQRCSDASALERSNVTSRSRSLCKSSFDSFCDRNASLSLRAAFNFCWRSLTVLSASSRRDTRPPLASAPASRALSASRTRLLASVTSSFWRCSSNCRAARSRAASARLSSL